MGLGKSGSTTTHLPAKHSPATLPVSCPGRVKIKTSTNHQCFHRGSVVSNSIYAYKTKYRFFHLYTPNKLSVVTEGGGNVISVGSSEVESLAVRAESEPGRVKSGSGKMCGLVTPSLSGSLSGRRGVAEVATTDKCRAPWPPMWRAGRQGNCKDPVGTFRARAATPEARARASGPAPTPRPAQFQRRLGEPRGRAASPAGAHRRGGGRDQGQGGAAAEGRRGRGEAPGGRPTHRHRPPRGRQDAGTRATTRGSPGPCDGGGGL